MSCKLHRLVAVVVTIPLSVDPTAMVTEGSWNNGRTSTCLVFSTNVWCEGVATVRSKDSGGDVEIEADDDAVDAVDTVDAMEDVDTVDEVNGVADIESVDPALDGIALRLSCVGELSFMLNL